MARRKTRAKPPPKKKVAKLETEFTCPFCNHTNSVYCEFDKKLKIAEAICSMCQESYSTTITHLTEPIDIYSEWIDACEGANNLKLGLTCMVVFKSGANS